MQLLTHVTKTHLHLRVDILHALGDAKLASLYLPVNLAEPRKKLVTLSGSEQTYCFKHCGVRH